VQIAAETGDDVSGYLKRADEGILKASKRIEAATVKRAMLVDKLVPSEEVVGQLLKTKDSIIAKSENVRAINRIRPAVESGRLTKEAMTVVNQVVRDVTVGAEQVVTQTARRGVLGKGGGLLEKTIMGGLFGPVAVSKDIKGGMAGRGFLHKFRSFNYMSGSLAGTVEAIKDGRIAQRLQNIYGGEIMSKVGSRIGLRNVRRGLGDIPGGQLGRLGTTSYGMPRYIAQDMMERGMRPSAEFFSQMRGLNGIRYRSAAQDFSRFLPRTNTIELATQGRAAMGSRFGMPTFFHEIGHAQAPKAEIARAMADKGGKGAIAAEFNAWKRAADSMKLAGVADPMAMKDFRGAAARSLYKYTGKGKESMQILDDLVKSNKLMGAERAGVARLLSGKGGAVLKGAGRFGLLAGLGDVGQLARPVEGIMGKMGMKGAGAVAGKGLGLLGKTMMGGGPLGLAMLGVSGVNFLKGDFMNEKVWKKLFGGKSIQEFVKDNPVSRALYKTFGKENVAAMFKPVQNLWDAATHATDAVANVGGMATGLFKGIFTGDWSSMKENASGFAKNVGGLVVDAGKTLVNVVKGQWQIGKAVGD
jgi:hypothetical protein